MPINMGPQHPSTHGVFRMVLVVNGEKVVDVVPHIGYMHRGGEKLMEAMDFRQGIGYCDRTEYLAQFSAELAYCMAVERLMDIEVPERAEYIRVILTELNRLSSHFMFAGAFGIDAGLFGTSFTYAFREREYHPGAVRGSLRRPPDVRVLPRRRARVGSDGQLRRSACTRC